MPAPSLSDFRVTLSEFADTTAHPDASITIWLTLAVNMVNECRWGALYNLGVYLVTAHNLVLGARDQATIPAGGIPGEMTGAIASKSVDKVSVSYDTNAATLANAGEWALTSYGTRFLRLSRQMGAGVIQL
jgi:hypothetical protein